MGMFGQGSREGRKDAERTAKTRALQWMKWMDCWCSKMAQRTYVCREAKERGKNGRRAEEESKEGVGDGTNDHDRSG